MRYGDDPMVIEMAGLLGQAIGQRIKAETGADFERKVTTDAYGYIIEFTAILPGPPGRQDPVQWPRRWAAEIRGSFQALMDSAASLTAEAIVARQAAEIAGMWRRDYDAAQTGVDHAVTISG